MRCLVSSVPLPGAIVGGSPGGTGSARPGKGDGGSSAYVAYELARLGSLLRHLGHEVLALDISRYGQSRVLGLLEDFAPEAVAVDASSFQDHSERHDLLRYFQLVKSVDPRTRTIWGGRDAAALAEFALLHGLVVDVVLCDESDTALPPLLLRWEQAGTGAVLEDLPGLAFRSDGDVLRTRRVRPNELVELDSLPFLDYSGVRLADGEWPLVLSSRGCPFGCRFCYRQYRFRRCHSVGYFVDHLEHLRDRHGCQKLRVDDELFTLDRTRCLAIGEEIARRGLGVEFDCYSRVDTFDEELGAALKRAGCRMVWFGVESGSDELLSRMGKDQKRETAVRAVAACRNAGLQVCCNVLLGYPGETRSSLLDTLLLLVELRPDKVSAQRVRVMPGTELFGWCEERHALDREAWILEDRDFCFEADFSRTGLDVLAQLFRQLPGENGKGVDEALAKYLILKGSAPLCLCRSVGEEELRSAFESGAASLGSLRERTGAATACGGCASSVATLLRVWMGAAKEA